MGNYSTIPANGSDYLALRHKKGNTTVETVAVTLTAAQIKALRATPVELVPAQGAGRVVEFVSAVFKLNYGSEVFTESSDNLAIRLTDGSGAIVSQSIEAGGFIDASADTYTNALAKIDTIVAATGIENEALVLHNTGDGEIAGNASNDSTIEVRVTYRVHDFS